MIESYERWADKDRGDVLNKIDERFPADGSENKAMRWLGFCQGILVERGIFTLEEVKIHSRDKEVTEGKDTWDRWAARNRNYINSL